MQRKIYLFVLVLAFIVNSGLSFSAENDKSQELVSEAFRAATGVAATFELISLSLTEFSFERVAAKASEQEGVADLSVLLSEPLNQGEVVGRLLATDLYPLVRGQSGDAVFKNAYVAVKKIKEARDRLNEQLNFLRNSEPESYGQIVSDLLVYKNNVVSTNRESLDEKISALTDVMNRVGQQGLYPR